jgi:rubrerythrin
MHNYGVREMLYEFNAEEVFEIAEEIERNGARFYRRGAEMAEGNEDRDLLLSLAEMEDSHVKIFASMREELLGSDSYLKDFDPQDEAVAYLRALADGKIFDLRADPVEYLGINRSMIDILQKALELEKDSVVFYTGILRMVPKALGREKIEHIIREEMRHIVSIKVELELRLQAGDAE